MIIFKEKSKTQEKVNVYIQDNEKHTLEWATFMILGCIWFAFYKLEYNSYLIPMGLTWAFVQTYLFYYFRSWDGHRGKSRFFALIVLFTIILGSSFNIYLNSTKIEEARLYDSYHQKAIGHIKNNEEEEAIKYFRMMADVAPNAEYEAQAHIKTAAAYDNLGDENNKNIYCDKTNEAMKNATNIKLQNEFEKVASFYTTLCKNNFDTRN